MLSSRLYSLILECTDGRFQKERREVETVKTIQGENQRNVRTGLEHVLEIEGELRTVKALM